MQLKFYNFAIAIAIVVGISAVGADHVQAAEGGVPGKPSRNYTSINDLPKGIQNKVNSDGSYRDGQREFNANSRWGQAIRQIQEFNAPCQGADCGPGTEIAAGEQAQAVVVCPTTLSDEEMRLCLGLPPVKKAVRVKRLNVQLGQAQD